MVAILVFLSLVSGRALRGLDGCRKIGDNRTAPAGVRNLRTPLREDDRGAAALRSDMPPSQMERRK